MITTSKPVIGFFSPVSNFKGGAEKCLVDFMENPAIQAKLITPMDGPLTQYANENNIETSIVDFGSILQIRRPFSIAVGIGSIISLFKAALALKKITKTKAIDIVHSNGLKAHAINVIARRLGGARAVVHIHDIPLTTAEKLVWYILYALSDHMILVSRPCWPGKRLPKHASIVHNGTPLVARTETAEQRTSDELRVCFIGRIHPAKGLHLLLEWIADAREAGHRGLTLIVKGAFSEDAPAYEGEIRSQISRLNLDDTVVFKGFVTDQSKLYNDVDVVVVPSHVPDPLPRSVMESMAHGVPVIGYPSGGIGEMIFDGKTGFFAKNSSDFAHAIQALSNNEKRSHITENAQKLIDSEFSMKTLYYRLETTYKSL